MEENPIFVIQYILTYTLNLGNWIKKIHETCPPKLEESFLLQTIMQLPCGRISATIGHTQMVGQPKFRTAQNNKSSKRLPLMVSYCYHQGLYKLSSVPKHANLIACLKKNLSLNKSNSYLQLWEDNLQQIPYRLVQLIA